MADGYGCVFLYQHHCRRFSDNKASADNNCLFAGAVDAVMVKNLHTCLRGARRETDLLTGEYAGHRKVCHAVHVFFRSQRVFDNRLVEMLRQRTEQKNAVDLVVFIYLIDHCQQFFLRNVLRKKDLLTCYAERLTALCSALLIRNIARIFADADNRQCRIYAFFLACGNVCLNSLIQRSRYLFAQ